MENILTIGNKKYIEIAWNVIFKSANYRNGALCVDTCIGGTKSVFYILILAITGVRMLLGFSVLCVHMGWRLEAAGGNGRKVQREILCPISNCHGMRTPEDR